MLHNDDPKAARTYHNQSQRANAWRLLDRYHFRLVGMADKSDMVDVFRAGRLGDDAAVVSNIQRVDIYVLFFARVITQG